MNGKANRQTSSPWCSQEALLEWGRFSLSELDHLLHIETRQQIKDIASVDRFNQIIECSTLDQVDKQIMRMHYLDRQDFNFIGDTLGFSESGIKKRHRKIIKKLSRII